MTFSEKFKIKYFNPKWKQFRCEQQVSSGLWQIHLKRQTSHTSNYSIFTTEYHKSEVMFQNTVRDIHWVWSVSQWAAGADRTVLRLHLAFVFCLSSITEKIKWELFFSILNFHLHSVWLFISSKGSKRLKTLDLVGFERSDYHFLWNHIVMVWSYHII